jgi:hypothetical protein
MEFNIEYAGCLSVKGACLINKHGLERRVVDVLAFEGPFRSNITVSACDLNAAIEAVREIICGSEFQFAGFGGEVALDSIRFVRALQRIDDDWSEVWKNNRDEQTWVRIG